MKQAFAISFPSKLSALVAALGIALACLWSPWGQAVERFTYDMLFEFRGSLLPPSDIVIVAVDEDSFDELNLQWPWPRGIHAKLIEELSQAGAGTIAFDITFSEPSSDPEEDKLLRAAIESFGPVVLANEVSEVSVNAPAYEKIKVINPVSVCRETSKVCLTGFVDLPVDGDMVIRRVRLRRFGRPALSLRAAVAYAKGRGWKLRLKTPVQSEALINFSGPPRTIPTISYYQALSPKTHLPKDFLKDKLVLVGFSLKTPVIRENASPDHYATPYRAQGFTSGVEINANISHNILRDSFIVSPNPSGVFLVNLLLALVFGFLFIRMRPLVSGLLFAAVSALFIAAAFLLFCFESTYASPLYGLVSLTLCYLSSVILHYVETQKQKSFIQQAFSTYLAPQVVERLIQTPELLELGGEEMDATVVFLDLAGFTSFSERLEPRELIQVVNRNLGEFAKIILDSGGMIDKYIGDCVMAVWGVPLSDAEHAKKACRAVLKMQASLENLQKAEEELTGVSIAMRVGVNSGRVVAGNVGGGRQFNYTVLGREVNLASRLEGINKLYGTTIIVSEATKKAVDAHFNLRELDIVRVKGEARTTVIYDLQGKLASGNQPQKELCALFRKGRILYQERKWAEALLVFEQVLGESPEDGPARVYCGRLREFVKTPPPDDWDGVYEILSK